MAKKNTQVKEAAAENLTSTETFIDKYKNYLLIGGGAIIVLILGIVGYQKFVSEPHEEESLNEYWQAMYEFEQDSLETAANGNEYFTGMLEIGEEYKGTSGGDIANYTMGVKSMRDGDFESAISFFDDCDFDDVMMGTLVLGLKGDCYVELDQYETAVDYFDQAANREQNEFTSPLFLKKAGLTYEALGKNDMALSAYQKIKDNWEMSTEAADIDKYIARAEN